MYICVVYVLKVFILFMCVLCVYVCLSDVFMHTEATTKHLFDLFAF